MHLEALLQQWMKFHCNNMSVVKLQQSLVMNIGGGNKGAMAPLKFTASP